MVGFLIVLLAAFFFCFQNVIVRILFNPQIILGVLPTGGFVEPTLYNSFLLMAMRMVVVVPLMASLSQPLYPQVWKDIYQLRHPQNRRSALHAMISGGLMFLYLALLYLSIGLIPTGIALTLFFTYPVFTACFVWAWFGNRPPPLQWVIMAGILIGSALTVPYGNQVADTQNLGLGIILGVASGVAHALYTVNAQKSFESMHPVPFTWISFAVTLGLSAICLLFWPAQASASPYWRPLWIGGLLSAIFTCTGHLLVNYGIRQIGATTTAMVSASNPALTVVLAWITIQETLGSIQILGVVLVTFCVILLSRVR
ncbi:MAG: DMT family transporter [Cyanobacteria bacterium P01_A01_bin.123]